MERAAIFKRVVGGSLSKNRTFEQIPEGGKEASQVD